MLRFATCLLATAALASPSTAALLSVSVESSVQADLPLTPVDLTATGDIDWAVWGLSELPTPGSLVPDVEKLGGTAIGPLSELNGDPIVDFSQFSFSPAFDWSDGTPTANGDDVLAALVSRENGVGAGFAVDIAVDASTRQVIFYGQNFQSEGTFTATLDGMTVTETVVSDTPGEFGDTGSIFTIDFETSSPSTLSLRWELTADLGILESIGLGAISVGSVPEPATVVLISLAAIAGLSRRRDG
ncbi:MAG: PEP-CTERM sorting domain-containing protein [Planctomycetota bacterium]